MAKSNQVLEMLIPTGGWVITGDDFNSIRYDEGVTPITKKQFEDGFAQVDALQAQEAAIQATTKSALLDRLGITADEAKLLLS
jgi:hypothetical protein